MITTLFVPLDGSPLAEKAVPYASAVAKALDAKVILFHAASPVARTLEHEVDPRAIVDRLAGCGLTVEGQVHKKACDEDVGRVIAAAVRECQADLLVMSTHGRGGLRRFAYGSVADQVLRHTTLPVLLVPAACERRWPDDRPQRILVCLDGSNLAEAALRPAGELATSFRAKLLLVRVVEPPLVSVGNRAVEFFGLEVIAEQARTSRYLDAMAGALRKAGHAIATRSIVGEAATGIATVATEQDVDLIAMATHGRGGLTRLMMGSATTKMIERATVPLLITRPTTTDAIPTTD